MKKGEIWVIDAGNYHGHEQAGVRPAVIVSEVIGHIVMVVPCTSSMNALRFPHIVQLFPSTSNNLPFNSVAMIFQLRAIDIKRLKKKIGVLSASEIRLINSEIKKMLKV